jgi:hypothetical protein
MTTRWHIIKDAGSVTLCRHLPLRFDIAAKTVLPRAHPLRLAHQIRQDLWRALQKVRGFSPVVRLDPVSAGWAVTAGGRAAGRVAPAVQGAAQAVLDDAHKRLRWVRNAGERA